MKTRNILYFVAGTGVTVGLFGGFMFKVGYQAMGGEPGTSLNASGQMVQMAIGGLGALLAVVTKLSQNANLSNLFPKWAKNTIDIGNIVQIEACLKQHEDDPTTYDALITAGRSAFDSLKERTFVPRGTKPPGPTT